MNFTIIPASYAPILHSVLRIVTGLIFMQHGTGKIFNLPPIHEKMLAMIGSGMLYFTGLMELVCGALILIGLFTRPVAFILSGMCAVAYFMVHFPQSFFPAANGGEAAMLYCFVFLYLSAAGGGVWSADAARGAP